MDVETLIKEISVVIFLIFIINILFKHNEKEEKKGKETIFPIIIYFLGAMVFYFIFAMVLKYLGIGPLILFDRN